MTEEKPILPPIPSGKQQKKPSVPKPPFLYNSSSKKYKMKNKDLKYKPKKPKSYIDDLETFKNTFKDEIKEEFLIDCEDNYEILEMDYDVPYYDFYQNDILSFGFDLDIKFINSHIYIVYNFLINIQKIQLCYKRNEWDCLYKLKELIYKLFKYIMPTVDYLRSQYNYLHSDMVTNDDKTIIGCYSTLNAGLLTGPNRKANIFQLFNLKGLNKEYELIERYDCDSNLFITNMYKFLYFGIYKNLNVLDLYYEKLNNLIVTNNPSNSNGSFFVYRGRNVKSIGEYNLDEDAQGFLSTSLNINIALSFCNGNLYHNNEGSNIILIIKIPVGAKVLYMGQLSSHKSENEILIPPMYSLELYHKREICLNETDISLFYCNLVERKYYKLPKLTAVYGNFSKLFNKMDIKNYVINLIKSKSNINYYDEIYKFDPVINEEDTKKKGVLNIVFDIVKELNNVIAYYESIEMVRSDYENMKTYLNLVCDIIIFKGYKDIFYGYKVGFKSFTLLYDINNPEISERCTINNEFYNQCFINTYKVFKNGNYIECLYNFNPSRMESVFEEENIRMNIEEEKKEKKQLSKKINRR